MMTTVDVFMVVGSNVDRNRLMRASSSLESLIEYSDNLVPSCLRHIPELLQNQRYFVAIELRNIKSIPFSKRNELANALLKGIYVSGTFDEIIFIDEVFAFANMDLVFQYIFKEELNNARQ